MVCLSHLSGARQNQQHRCARAATAVITNISLRRLRHTLTNTHKPLFVVQHKSIESRKQHMYTLSVRCTSTITYIAHTFVRLCSSLSSLFCVCVCVSVFIASAATIYIYFKVNYLHFVLYKFGAVPIDSFQKL